MAFPEGPVQVDQRTSTFGDQQQPRRVEVEAVHEIEKAMPWSQAPQPLDETETVAATAVHREPGWFVQRHQIFIFVEDRRFQRIEQGRRWKTLPGRPPHPQRRNADDIPGLESIVLPGPLSIDPYLTTTKNPVYAGSGHALQSAAQEVVDALTTVAPFDVNFTYRAWRHKRRFRHGAP